MPRDHSKHLPIFVVLPSSFFPHLPLRDRAADGLLRLWSAEGKVKSSLNTVKTGLAGRTILLADEEEAAQYCAHVARLIEYWEPANVREHTLVQFLADVQWRLDSIPGLESGLYALGRVRYAELFAEEEPSVRRVLLDTHIENTDAKALKNLRLHECWLERR